MSVQSAKANAELLAKQHRGNTPPVDVEGVARALGLAVVFSPLGPDVSGMLVTNQGKSVVVVHSKHARPRQRFTIAHEIGHYVLGHQWEPGDHVHVDHGNFISQRGPRASTGLDPKEIEANQFAATLLMPTGTVRNEVAARVGKRAILDSDVEFLSQRFEVSEQAMTIRLTTLGLL
jgi:Zn-dependent peptidase ImmA (M78 family)